MRRRDLLVLAGGSLTVATAGCMGNDDESTDGETNDNETDATPSGTEDTQNDTGEQRAPAAFEVSQVTFDGATLSTAETVELSVQITNTGEQNGTKPVELRRNGIIVDSQQVELDAEAEATVTFSTEVDLTLGDYEFTVLTPDSEGRGVVTIAEGEFAVENLDPADITVEQGATLDVGADIINVSSVEDTKPVELRVDGERVDRQQLTLTADGQQFVEFRDIDTNALSLNAEQHSIWTPDDEATGSLSLDPVEIEPGTLELTVVNSENNAIEGASVSAEGINAATGSDGSLSTDVRPGEYNLTVTFGEAETTQEVTIEEGQTETLTVRLPIEGAGAITGFSGANRDGFTAFDEETESDARANGIEFPPGDVAIAGNVSDGEWESTNVNFAELDVQGLPTQVEAPNGLRGTFDPEAGVMTVEGQLRVTVSTAGPFSYEIAATTGESGALTGSADFESGSFTIVDNEFTVNDTSDDPIVNESLGLPLEEPGKGWLELVFDFGLERE